MVSLQRGLVGQGSVCHCKADWLGRIWSVIAKGTGWLGYHCKGDCLGRIVSVIAKGLVGWEMVSL